MSMTLPSIQDLARRLLAAAPSSGGASDEEIDRAVSVCQTLGVPLKRLTGAAGLYSILSRALARARRLTPELNGLSVDASGAIQQFIEIQPEGAAPILFRQGGVVLVTEFLTLLVVFIGEPLTLSLVREAWPNTSFDGIFQH